MPKYPRLRSLETLVVPDSRHGRVLVLRDTHGIASGHACIPPALVPVVARFTGEHPHEQIARDASAEAGVDISVELVRKLADELDEALFLDSPTFHRARANVERAFATSPVRKAAHAGGAYSNEAADLRKYLDESCLGRASPGLTSLDGHEAPIVGLVAPHIDPWRGAVGYGHAYGALAARLPPEADTFIVFGTSHAPMREPFALCRKSFDTPLGTVSADFEAIDELASAAQFDPYADQFNHKREHSLEFQVVFLKHLLGEKPVRIVPILAGLGEHQASGSDPSEDSAVESFLEATRNLVESRPGRTVVIAGADLAHVGPRFGDRQAMTERERAHLEKADRESLARAVERDPAAFWHDVARDLDTRRVCGLAPIYALLKSLPTRAAPAKAKPKTTNGHTHTNGFHVPSHGRAAHARSNGAHARVLHYEQTVDKEDGSIVSHAGVAFFDTGNVADGAE
ncbi:AmmeMemoRadiSam system protein B [Pendulispora albinea]|uniref:AmmeMemoRadiSam system protein B n=1 Tax=Pendulispora albinea TaxID=2741071 RepID=A0ABZ2LLB0_9BACT